MTIEDAIKHCRDTALSNAGNAIAYLKGGQKMLAESCEKCAAEHEQLAKWLEELKQRRKAEPVRHGRWIECDYKHLEHGMIEIVTNGGLFCSECGTAFQKKKMTYKQYCAACGAKMDGGEKMNARKCDRCGGFYEAYSVRIAGCRCTVSEVHYHRTGRKTDEQEGRQSHDSERSQGISDPVPRIT